MSELWVILERYGPEFVSAFGVTLQIVVQSLLLAMVVGVLVATLRVSPPRLTKAIGTTYVELFRNIPLLVLVFIFFAGFRRAGIPIGRMTAATLSLGLYTAAYIAESIRSGVFAVGKGQIEAGLSLGFTYTQTLRRIVIPQAVRTVIPPIGNLIIAMVKNSAIMGASLLALDDLLKISRIANSNTFQPVASFLPGAVGYLILTITATFAVKYSERRFAVRR